MNPLKKITKMKRIIVGIFLFCLMFGSLFYVFYTKKSSWTNYALNSPRIRKNWLYMERQ